MFTVIYDTVIKAFVEDFDHCRKPHCRTPFAEQLFAEYYLIEYLSMVASIIYI